MEHTDQEIDMIGNYGFCMADRGQLYSSYSILSRYAIPNVLETENLFLIQKKKKKKHKKQKNQGNYGYQQENWDLKTKQPRRCLVVITLEPYN